MDYVTICHMAQYHRARVSFSSGEKWRRRGGRKERREKNAETVEYNSCQRPTTTTMRCKQAFFSNQCAALIVASILWLRARAVCRLVDGKTIRKYEG